MAVTGFQDFWITGSRLYFQREAVEGVEQPLIDLGIIKVANPDIAPEVVELEDSDGGIRVVAEEGLTKIEEVYTIECNNLAPVNLAMLFLAELEDFAQTAEVLSVTHYAHPGSLLKIKDDDDDGTWLYGLTAIAGIYTAGTISTAVLTAINAGTKTLTLTGDQTTDMVPGKKVIISPTGLANIANAKTVTVVSSSFSSTTSVVIEEEILAETAITGQVIFQDEAADTAVVLDDEVDWDIISLDRGLVRLNSSSAEFTAAGNVVVVFKKGAITTSKRLINPQSLKGTIKGKAVLVWGRGNNAQQTMREFSCTITPAGSAMSDTDFSSISFRVRVTSDLTQDNPAGRLIYTKGDVPSVDVSS